MKIAIIAGGTLIIGVAFSLFLCLRTINALRRKIRTLRTGDAGKSIGTMNIVLIVVGVSLLAFTVVMIHVFLVYGAIPDTLCTCVFAALGGECGVMGMIKSSKEKYRERKWAQEDKKQAEADAEMDKPRNEL